MENDFSTAVESAAEQIEQIEPIRPSDLTITNLRNMLEGLLPDIRKLAFNIIVCIVIYLVGRQIIRLMHRMLDRALRRRSADAGLTKFLDSVLDISMRAFLIFMILGQLGVNTASIITVFGTALIAIGMSLQGSLANVAGGILILLMKPFRVGDYVMTTFGDGTVQAIGLVYTTITTVDNRVLTIPNGTLSNSAVFDTSAMPERRLDISVGISYDSDIKKAKEVMERVYLSCPAVIAEKGINVHVSSLGDSSVGIEAFGWVPKTEYLSSKWYIMEEIKLQYDAEGIKIPYPQMDVHLDAADEPAKQSK